MSDKVREAAILKQHDIAPHGYFDEHDTGFRNGVRAALADSAPEDAPCITMTKSYLSGRQCCAFTIAEDDSETHEAGCPWRIVDEFANRMLGRIRLMPRGDSDVEWLEHRTCELVEDMTSSPIRRVEDAPPSTNPDTDEEAKIDKNLERLKEATLRKGEIDHSIRIGPVADRATLKRSPEETQGEHETGFCWCGAYHERAGVSRTVDDVYHDVRHEPRPDAPDPDTSVDGEPTDEMVRAALTIETDEGGPISQDIGFGMMRLMLRAALAVHSKSEW